VAPSRHIAAPCSRGRYRVEADMTSWAEFDDLVAIDPSRKSEFIQVRSDGLSCVLAARHRENLKS